MCSSVSRRRRLCRRTPSTHRCARRSPTELVVALCAALMILATRTRASHGRCAAPACNRRLRAMLVRVNFFQALTLGAVILALRLMSSRFLTCLISCVHRFSSDPVVPDSDNDDGAPGMRQKLTHIHTHIQISISRSIYARRSRSFFIYLFKPSSSQEEATGSRRRQARHCHLPPLLPPQNPNQVSK